MDLGADSITILRAPPVDEDGDPTGPPAEIPVVGCNVQPSTSREDTDQRVTVTGEWTAWLPPGTDVRPTDRILWDGQTYEVDGAPAAWKDLQAVPHHVQIQLKRVTG